MISFIVIGRNEGWRLSKCFEGLNKVIKYNKLIDFEIIYVDSDSNDKSIEIAKSNNVNRIYKISGNVNAAIARNVGANESLGEILFFLDGDIEVNPFHFSDIIRGNNILNYGYVVGFLDDVNYDSNWNFINQTPRHYKEIIQDKVVTTVGGAIFIIPKLTWNKFGGMDERLKRTQDRDFSLRMAKDGITGIRKAEVFGLHHTVSYKDKKRMWDMLFKGSINYKGVMIRKHINNTAFYPILVREESSLIVLVLSILLVPFSIYFLLLYPLAVLVRNIKYRLKGKQFFMLLLHRVMQDLVVLFSIFFFYVPEQIFFVEEL